MLLILSPCWACSCSCPHRKALHTCPTCSDVAASHIDGSNRNTVRINSDARHPSITCVHFTCHFCLIPTGELSAASQAQSNTQKQLAAALRNTYWTLGLVQVCCQCWQSGKRNAGPTEQHQNLIGALHHLPGRPARTQCAVTVT